MKTKKELKETISFGYKLFGYSFIAFIVCCLGTIWVSGWRSEFFVTALLCLFFVIISAFGVDRTKEELEKMK